MEEKNQEKIVKEYAQAFRQFANVSGSAQRILVTMPNFKDEILKKGEINSQFISSILSEGDPHKPANQQPIIYHISDYVVDPQDASNVPITKLYESIDYMTYISNQIQKIEPNQSMIADRNNVIDNTNIKNSINSNKIIFQKLKEDISQQITSKETSYEISDYYRTMMDLDFGSKNLRSLIDTCAQLSNYEPKQSEVYPIGVIKNANQGFLNSFRTKINQISQRFKTFAKDIGDFVIKSISKVEKVISETVGKVLPETIAEVLTELSEKFLDFVGMLLERMFTFLSQFGPLANKIGYSLSEVEIKLATVQIQQVSIIPGLTIPLPTIAPPDITIKIKSLKGQ